MLLWWQGHRPAIEPARPGVHLLLDDGRSHWPQTVWAEHMAYAAAVSGPGGYVTQLIRLDDLDQAKWQHFMDLCAEYELVPIIRLATTYDREAGWWVAPPVDGENGRYTVVAQQQADFLASLTWPTEAWYVVVGNEPNHGDEWSGRPDPAAYARYLMDVAARLHTLDERFHVLNGGFDLYTPHTGSQPWTNGMWYMDAESFMDEMTQAEPTVWHQLDGWASHPYPMGPFQVEPSQQTFQIDWLNDAHNPWHQPPPQGIVNRGINGYEWELWKLGTYGIRPLPVFITETGWRHTVPPYPSAVEAGQYLRWAWGGPDTGEASGWRPWGQDPRVVAVTPFALNGVDSEWAPYQLVGTGADG